MKKDTLLRWHLLCLSIREARCFLVYRLLLQDILQHMAEGYHDYHYDGAANVRPESVKHIKPPS